MNATDWTVMETAEAEFNPTQLHHKETVFTLSNGYLGTRGSYEEGFPGASPATLINGIYDDAPIVSPELVNCPDWLLLTILIGDAAEVQHRFRLDQGTVIRYQRWLDMQRGLLNRQIRWRSPHGQTLDLWFERLVSLADPHVMALRCRIAPIDFDAPFEVHASLNGYPSNDGLLHWDWLDQGGQRDSVWLHSRTRHSKVELGMAARLQVAGAEDVQLSTSGFQAFPTIIAKFHARSRQSVMLEKLVTVFTSRDTEMPVQAAQTKLAELTGYAAVREAHETAWARQWQDNDVIIEGDSTAQLAIRYNLFQLLSAAPRTDSRVSIPAKTLSGFAYRGHIFWDTEIFVLPLLTLTQPELARNLLNYRYHGLAGARRKAEAAGFSGAMYAWESADTGNETTPTWIPGPKGDLIRIWCGDIEQHISTDVAYAVYQYWQATDDRDWMQDYGAEMLLDTAVFWGSRVEWNAEHDRYEIRDVIGPDEYHDRIDNNTFTNRMVQWHLQTALEVLDWLQSNYPTRAAQLIQQLGLTRDRLAHWQTVIQKLWILQDSATGLIEQFQGFFDCEDINLTEYEPRTKSMQVILGIEGANQRQVLKQADVLMLMYLLRDGMFVKGSSEFDRATLQTNWDYYVPRTDHTYGSSLGPPVHAILACDLGKVHEAYDHFMRAALVDLADVRGNAAEGIHAASAGGVWQAVIFGFGGIRLTENGPIASPRLPQGWKRLQFKLRWQGKTYAFDLKPSRVIKSVTTTAGSLRPSFRALEPTPSRAIQGVIFDLDGVLTDTSEFHYLGWKRLADELNIPFDRHQNENLRGVSRRDSLRYLLGDRSVSEAQFQDYMDRKNSYYLELIKSITPEHLLPGALELLKELRAQGIKIAIGSASKNAKPVVHRLGISVHIDAIADGFSVIRSKPHPDVFLYAAEKLGLDPTACVVVEDAAAGVEAALRAGMWSIGLGPQSRVGAAHLVLPNLEHVRWSDLAAHLSALTDFQAADLTLQQLTHQMAHPFAHCLVSSGVAEEV